MLEDRARRLVQGAGGAPSAAYWAWVRVKTGSKKVGWAWAALNAADTCATVAPDATRSVVRAAGSFTRLPSTPTTTSG